MILTRGIQFVCTAWSSIGPTTFKNKHAMPIYCMLNKGINNNLNIILIFSM